MIKWKNSRNDYKITFHQLEPLPPKKGQAIETWAEIVSYLMKNEKMPKNTFDGTILELI